MYNDGEIIRERIQNNFSIIPNEILNAPDISLRAKGLLCWMLSKPDNWKFYKSTLHEGQVEGRDAINKAWSELVKAGYVRSQAIRGEGGKMAGYFHYVYSRRITGNPLSGENNRDTGNPASGEPVTGKPETGKPPVIRTNKKRNQEKEIPIPDGIGAAVNGTEVPEVAPPGSAPPPRVETGHPEVPGGANLADNPPDGQQPPKDPPAGNGQKKGKDGMYAKFIDIYHTWFKETHDGIPPKIDGAAGKAAKAIITYLKNIAKNQHEVPETEEDREEAALNAWSYILKNWYRIEPFYQQKTRLIDINSNLQNILTQLKNGTAQQKRTTNDTTAADVATAFANIDNYFANRQS